MEEQQAQRERDTDKIKMMQEKLRKTHDLLYDSTKDFLELKYEIRANKRLKISMWVSMNKYELGSISKLIKFTVNVFLKLIFMIKVQIVVYVYLIVCIILQIGLFQKISTPPPPQQMGSFLTPPPTSHLDFLKYKAPPLLLSGFPRQKTPLPPGFPGQNIRLKFNLF